MSVSLASTPFRRMDTSWYRRCTQAWRIRQQLHMATTSKTDTWAGRRQGSVRGSISSSFTKARMNGLATALRRATARTCGFTKVGRITCLLYTSDAADEEDSVDLGGR